jgi:hypothetical protein
MKNDIPRLFPLWFILMLTLLFVMCSGCRTGGTRLNPNSAGTIIRTSDVRPNFEPLPPVPIAPPVPVPIAPPVSTPVVITNAVKSNPIAPELKSAKANPVTSNPESAGLSATPFEPTISPSPILLPELETKLPPRKTKLPTKIVEGDGGCVVITDNNGSEGKPEGWCGTENPQVAGPCEAAPEESQSTPINSVNLFSLFVMLLLGAIGFWVIYDIIKDSIQMKKQGTPIKDHLKGLKKPAKGTRASRKKATNKKKPAKKKTTRKKKS